MRAPQHVTFTGLDQWTDLGRVAEMSSRWPIEWGVLFSAARQGSDPRYPPLDWIAALGTLTDLRLAAHLCGRHADAALTGLGPDDIEYLFPMFGRMQVNTARAKIDVQGIASCAHRYGLRPVLQTRDPGAFPTDDRVDWLYDPSGGRGLSPAEKRWPTPRAGRGELVGYAGGLGPDNIAESRDLIAAAAGDAPYWVDMETRIRSGNPDGSDRLDLDKCAAVCCVLFGEG